MNIVRIIILFFSSGEMTILLQILFSGEINTRIRVLMTNFNQPAYRGGKSGCLH